MSQDLIALHDCDFATLAAASSVNTTDLVAVKQSSTHKKATVAQLLTALVTHGVVPAYVSAGTAVASTFHIVLDTVTATGASTTVTLTAPSTGAFASANYLLLIVDLAAQGTLIAPSAQAAGSFSFASTNTHSYIYLAIGA